MSTSIDIENFLSTIETEMEKFRVTTLKNVAKKTRDPFRVLIGCIISLRTKDEVTHEASTRLFNVADSPTKMSNLSEEDIEKLIYPAGFYRNKAKQIKEIAKQLAEEHNSKVPKSIDQLVSFKGVGRKTANLVVTLGYNLPGICVDTHVARIVHRIGYIEPKKFDEKGLPVFHSPDDVEMKLRKRLPKIWWIPINDLLVTWGQNICKPISPICSKCFVFEKCPKVGVIKNR
ncbi:MAG: Ultraviolet N-glycosylase/AP lyase [Candidatus Heimdallarchaeota archaeon LC_3]|nr:MAG: Ultraviolet N-glycosylase/AP lyase [Candidatus Heimdallarchaeota archaeon LC_3]